MMIEQPLAHDDIIDHAMLQSSLDTPICLDECIRSAHHAEQAIRLKACRIINIKLGRVGGFARSKTDARCVRMERHSCLVRGHARIRYWPGAQHCAFHAAEFCPSWRCIGEQTVLEAGRNHTTRRSDLSRDNPVDRCSRPGLRNRQGVPGKPGCAPQSSELITTQAENRGSLF